MAHKIRVSFLGEGETLPAIVHAVLKDCVIPPENIFLSDKDTAVKEQNLKQNVVFCPDDMDVVVKGEIVVVQYICALSTIDVGYVLHPKSLGVNDA